MENRKYIILGAIGGFFLLLIFPIFLGACLKGGGPTTSNANINARPPTSVPTTKKIVFWGLYDDQQLYQGVFQDFASSHPGFMVEYHKFTDVNEYRDLLINEIAEGKGPDVAMMHNSWILKDKNKLAVFPTGKEGMNIDKFKGKDGFVGVAVHDLVLPDETGIDQIWGFPGSVDTLALYYNSKLLRETSPSEPIPSAIWTSPTNKDFVNQVALINKPNLSIERFFLSGVAMGRYDNITKAGDILTMLLLQYGTKMYDETMQISKFADSTANDAFTNQPIFPSKNALQLFTSFGNPDFKNYSWNKLITTLEKNDYEIGSFVSGKVAMIFGYSYTMKQIQNVIDQKKIGGKTIINADDIEISVVPQATDQDVGKVALASYYPFVVPKNSQYQSEAWDLILRLVAADSQQYYWETEHKPTSLVSMITDQQQDPIYAPFAEQLGYAQSLQMVDAQKTYKVFEAMINDVLEGRELTTALRTANTRLQCLLDQYNGVQSKEGVNCVGDATSSIAPSN